MRKGNLGSKGWVQAVWGSECCTRDANDQLGRTQLGQLGGNPGRGQNGRGAVINPNGGTWAAAAIWAAAGRDGPSAGNVNVLGTGNLGNRTAGINWGG